MKKTIFLFFSLFILSQIHGQKIIQIGTTGSQTSFSHYKENVLLTLNTNQIQKNGFFTNQALSLFSTKHNTENKEMNWASLSVGIGKYFKTIYKVKPYITFSINLNYINIETTSIEITPGIQAGLLIKTIENISLQLDCKQNLLIQTPHKTNYSIGLIYTLPPKTYKTHQSFIKKNKKSSKLKKIKIKKISPIKVKRPSTIEIIESSSSQKNEQ